MGISELDHRTKRVGGISPNVQRSIRFSLKVSAEVSKVKPYRPLGPLGFDFAEDRQTLRPSTDGICSKTLRPFGVQ